ncbi:tRNA pseudouridine(55) synthase TruB, partial [bacterium]|nr:tRNA pseudouridine(55) synthase TruB [bacterium]
MFGFLNINKPSGISSHKVIAILRKILGIKQIGHAGTLDPLANGVLPVAVGKASKLIDYLPSDKRYIAGLEFGKISDTYDIEGTIEQTGYRKITLEEIQNALVNLRGEVSQVPPAYSAVHYNGKRLYELAREGKIPDDIPARKINIYKNEVLDFDFEHQILKLD